MSPHGKKLYHLYVSDPAGYAAAAVGAKPAPVGLTLIKEAHKALPLPLGGGYVVSTDPEVPALAPGEITELFMMQKVGHAQSPNTDAGWVYGVATPDGEVYASGRIESCIGCHERSEHDRLFGIAPATTVYFEQTAPYQD